MRTIRAAALVSLASLASLAFAIALSGCGGDGGGYACPAYAAADFVIVVTDAATGQRICDATVTATDTATTESATLSGSGGATDCSYSGGFYERPGTFNVMAARTGYTTATKSGVTVTKGLCNVAPAQVTIPLSH